VLTSAQVRTRPDSEQRQQLLLQTAGLGCGALPSELASPQDHRIEVALEIEGTLKALTQFVGAEGKGGALKHGLTGWGPERG
jgi:hypothetical protein